VTWVSVLAWALKEFCATAWAWELFSVIMVGVTADRAAASA